MNNTIREYRNQRATLITQAREMTEAASKANRNLTSDENVRWDKFMEDVEALNLKINREEKLYDLEQSIDGDLKEVTAGGKNFDKEEVHPTNTKAYKNAFVKNLLTGHFNALTPEESNALQKVRNLVAGTASEGGNVIAPQEWVASLIKGLDDAVFVRKHATKHTLTTSLSLGKPYLESDLGDYEWTGEIDPVTEDNSMTFGKRELKPEALAKLIKVSRRLAKFSSISIDQLVLQRLIYKMSVTEEKAFLLGDGISKPLGLYVPSTNGISVARDVTGSNTTTTISPDTLIDAKYNLKAGYLSDARWNFHRDIVKEIMKMKVDGKYILNPYESSHDKILDIPYDISEFAPNTLAADNYIGGLFNYKYYEIADSLQMEIQTLYELFSTTNQIGYIARKETDAMPVLEEAFVRIKMASA